MWVTVLLWGGGQEDPPRGAGPWECGDRQQPQSAPRDGQPRAKTVLRKTTGRPGRLSPPRPTPGFSPQTWPSPLGHSPVISPSPWPPPFFAEGCPTWLPRSRPLGYGPPQFTHPSALGKPRPPPVLAT